LKLFRQSINIYLDLIIIIIIKFYFSVHAKRQPTRLRLLGARRDVRKCALRHNNIYTLLLRCCPLVAHL